MIDDWLTCPVCGSGDDITIRTDGEHMLVRCDFCGSGETMHYEAGWKVDSI